MPTIEIKLSRLFERFRPFLPKEVIEEGLDLIAHNECGVAHELLSQMLFEYSVQITADDLKDLQEIASLMSLNPSSLDFLRPLIQSEK